jgi:hypothetical protein
MDIAHPYAVSLGLEGNGVNAQKGWWFGALHVTRGREADTDRQRDKITGSIVEEAVWTTTSTRQWSRRFLQYWCRIFSASEEVRVWSVFTSVWILTAKQIHGSRVSQDVANRESYR